MNQHEQLAEAYRRLAAASRAVVDGCVAVGDTDDPMCGVAPHLVRTLRRELDGTPQPTGKLTWMSPT